MGCAEYSSPECAPAMHEMAKMTMAMANNAHEPAAKKLVYTLKST